MSRRNTAMPLAVPGPLATRMFTLAEVAAITGWSVSHLRRQMRLKVLVVHRSGRTIRVSQQDLDAFLARVRGHRA